MTVLTQDLPKLARRKQKIADKTALQNLSKLANRPV
jgi:hypothetical protein